jgi:hypothetical protein
MKNAVLILISILFCSLQAIAQCSEEPNKYEVRLSPTANKALLVQIRYNGDLQTKTNDALPTATTLLDGLVFAVTWPQTSDVKITGVKPLTMPFSIITDKEAEISFTAKTVGADKIVTFYHDAVGMALPYNFNWQSNEWYDIATITYIGQLTPGDYFSLLNCDYGLANPNSYSGNSSTDPWFAMRTPTNEYLQYSPKMITVLPAAEKATVFNVYPNPTVGILNINIESAIESSVAIAVYDMSGKLMQNVGYNLIKGSNTTVVDLKDLTPGTYSVKITDGKSLNYVTNVVKL